MVADDVDDVAGQVERRVAGQRHRGAAVMVVARRHETHAGLGRHVGTQRPRLIGRRQRHRVVVVVAPPATAAHDAPANHVPLQATSRYTDGSDERPHRCCHLASNAEYVEYVCKYGHAHIRSP